MSSELENTTNSEALVVDTKFDTKDELPTAAAAAASAAAIPQPSDSSSAPTSPTSPKVAEANANETSAANNTVPATPSETTNNSPEIAQKEAEEQQQKNAERDREIVEEFEYLLEKSQQLFTGLSDLPEIGSKYWMPQFQRTFEVYTRLWKFQNQHRVLLEKPEHYGLKRWEVGEMASKIGQLYYRYYLRTSDTNNLHEAYVFYEAIRERNYFKGEQETKNSALMIKKLRYYARFIVVCLQMNNVAMMLQLLEEVRGLIDLYATTFNPVDKMEWSLVVKEMALFMQAVCGPLPTDEGGASLPVSYRLSTRRRPKVDRDGPRVRLQEAVIVGNRPTQIKFSELTLDMYYMLQMLEREPTNVSAKDGAKEPEAAPAAAPLAATDEGSAVADSTAVSPEAAGVMTADAEKKLEGAAQAGDAEKEKERADIAGDKDSERDKTAVGRRNNPHKYVLYQPHFSQIQVYLANAFREIGEQGCVLLYLSSEGSSAKPATETSTAAALSHGFIGGISTTRRSTGETKDRSIEQLVHTVHPADLLPYTRKPFFLIVESESSGAYLNMPNLFNQPLLCLLSPTAYPVSSSSGSIYTFFLHSPVIAFCIISQVTMMTGAKWSEVQRMFDALEDRVFELLLAKVTDARVRKFLGDDFLRQMVVRHVICCVALGLHVEFSRPEHLPRAEPERFEAVVEDGEVIGLVRGIVAVCGVEALYTMADKVQSRSPSPVPSVASAVSPTVPEAADAETAVSGLVSEESSSPQ